MAFPSRALPNHLRQGSTSTNPTAQPVGQSPALLARVNEKRAELENLQELRDLSAAVASQMEALEQKLATLSDGTEAIATVLGNWHNVLRAINMASGRLAASCSSSGESSGLVLTRLTAKIPSPRNAEEAESKAQEDRLPLPQTLVRIPTEHAPALQAQTEGAMESDQNNSLVS
ncbi:DASH complex subunit Dad2-domain-containing protein [Durotheca rogersii]|uniref:DASH complex subunit Dad2-domain-containing protein n=1 Tax=Durotheca rogersii TaxID=419775 RepID=UPI00222061E0|nr:DASH complex subunit Dad2-domain-containing protein [Durotheca rogersii]KAI5863356.1 DASH complex subunit Dad2-domain-containing protein [Durotheca rogersii]